MNIKVIHAEKDFLVINKPAGVAVHGGPGVKGPTLADWLLAHYPEVSRVGDEPRIRPGIVHRLDRDTSGVMIVARTQQAFEDLKALFKNRKIEKTYLALVCGAPRQTKGEIRTPIGRLVSNLMKRGIGPRAIKTREALTRYRVLERFGGYSLLAVIPKTGRMHQIRVHLASSGLPVAGDTRYGGRRAALAGLSRQFLHAWRLEFSYPDGRRWQFEAPLAPDLGRVLALLRHARRVAKRRAP